MRWKLLLWYARSALALSRAALALATFALASFTAAAARSTFAAALSVFARDAPTALTCEAMVRRWSVIWPWSVLRPDLALSSAYSYGRGSISKSTSPCLMKALSCTGSWVMGPSTCGAMPIKLANTSASSVRGYRLVRLITNAPVTTAATMMAMLTILPRRRRGASVSISGIASPSGLTEEQKPEGKSEKRSQTGVNQDERGHELVLKLDAHKK